MSQGDNPKTPPPLPNVGDADLTNVEPPPVVDDSSTDSAVGLTKTATPSDSPERAADPLDEFLSRAGAVLALERGMNARSRVKLAAIAEELGLSDDEFAAAMDKVLGGKTEVEKQLSKQELRAIRRRKRAFHNHVGETLMALPHGVLTASMEQMLIDDGMREHELSAEEAQADVVQMAKQLRIRRITREEAERHIAGLADQAIEAAGTLRKDIRQRIITEGSRWGLTPDQVEPILRQRLSRVRMGEKKEQMRMVALVSASAAVLVGVLGMIAWMAFSNALPNTDTPIATAEDGEPPAADTESSPSDGSMPDGSPDTTPVAPRKFPVPKWWNDDLSAYVVNVRLRIKNLEPDLYQLRSPKAEERVAAYDKLLAAAQSGDLDKSDRAVLAGLFAAAYAAEPAEACADHLREAWMKVATAATKDLLRDTIPYEQSLWIALVANTALLEPDLPDERRTALLDALDRTLDTTLDRDLRPIEFQRQLNGAVGAMLYKSLSRHAAENVDLAVDLHDWLWDEIRPDVHVATADRLHANYLRQVLPALGDRWQQYEDLIRRAALSEDPLNVLLMIEIFETTTQSDLQAYLGTQLVVRAGLTRTAPRDPAQLASAVREALGVTRGAIPISAAERHDRWREAAQTQLDKPMPAADDTTKLLEDIVQTARLQALGAALAKGELGEAEFNSLWEEEEPTLTERRGSSPRTPPSAPRVNTSTLKALERNIDPLRNYTRLERGQRVGYLQLIGNFAPAVTDVQADQGQVIAAYLAAPKGLQEHQRAMELADKVLRWRMVRLGLADKIEESRLREEHLGELIGKALARDVDIKQDGWRQRRRHELLAQVASELSTQASLSGDSSSTADDAAELLTDYYRRIARLQGISATAYSDAPSPSEVLRLLVEKSAANVSGKKLSLADRQFIDELPHRLVAVDFVAENDLARTVQFQRMWLRLLEMNRSGDTTALATTDSIYPRLIAEDTTATHLVQQVAAGERALLEFWLKR